MKICQENPNVVKIGRKYRGLCVKISLLPATFNRRDIAVFEWHCLRPCRYPWLYTRTSRNDTWCLHCLSCFKICCREAFVNTLYLLRWRLKISRNLMNFLFFFAT